MHLVIDVGNTVTKTAVFSNREIRSIKIMNELSLDYLADIKQQHPEISSTILSTVKDVPEKSINYLNTHFNTVLFTSESRIPVINKYKSKQTLGNDRLAAVVGAASAFPGLPCLVIDAGTCITYDFIDRDKNYYGGAISPGIDMRLKALHNFTGKLPLVNFTNFERLIGENTQESILSGVVNGVVAETEYWIAHFRQSHPSVKVIVCGGNTDFFADRLKSSIFAFPNLVLEGLNEILIYNENF